MIGVGLVGMVIAVLLRQYKPEYAVFVSLAVGILIIGMLCSQLLPIFDELERNAVQSQSFFGIYWYSDKKPWRLLSNAVSQRCLP